MQIILTNHAQERMRLRKMARSDIERTLSHPERSFPGKKEGTVKFVRRLDGRQHEVIGKYLPDEKSWLVLSVWVRGEEDRNWNTVIFSSVGNVIKFLLRIISKLFR